MAEKQLITVAMLVDGYDVSKNLRENRVSGHIMRAQRNDVKPILGEALYYDMIENSTTTENQKLLKGGSYDYCGNTIYFQGVEDLISAFTYSRILAANSTFITNAGNKIKTDPNSDPKTKADEVSKSRESVSDALAISYGVQKFLDNNPSDYPLYNNATRRPNTRTSFTFIKV